MARANAESLRGQKGKYNNGAYKTKETKHACIEIYWTDYEGGCNYFVEGEAYFDAVEGLSVNSIDQLDLTPENLVEYGHYDCIDDAKEDLGIE